MACSKNRKCGAAHRLEELVDVIKLVQHWLVEWLPALFGGKLVGQASHKEGNGRQSVGFEAKCEGRLQRQWLLNTFGLSRYCLLPETTC